MVPAAGVEPATSRSGGERSNPLSYAGMVSAAKDTTAPCDSLPGKPANVRYASACRVLSEEAFIAPPRQAKEALGKFNFSFSPGFSLGSEGEPREPLKR